MYAAHVFGLVAIRACIEHAQLLVPLASRSAHCELIDCALR